MILIVMNSLKCKNFVCFIIFVGFVIIQVFLFENILLQCLIELMIMKIIKQLKVSNISSLLINKKSIKSIKIQMSEKVNFNPEKQEQINILGYMNGPKLFKTQNQTDTLGKTQQRKNKILPLLSLNNPDELDQTQIELNTPISNSKTLRFQKGHDFQEADKKGFYTPRNNQKQSQKKSGFEFQRQFNSQAAEKTKNPLHSLPRNRFYYKQEYDSLLQKYNQNQKDKREFIKMQSRSILPGYFKKIKQINQKNLQFNTPNSKDRQPKTRQRSPLQESYQKMLAKCSKEMSSHLQVMLKEINSCQESIHLIQKQITNAVYSHFKQRTNNVRNTVIQIVESIINDWEAQQLQFVQKNQILFIDDILQLNQHLNSRQDKVKLLIKQLEHEKISNWTNNPNIPYKNNLRGNVTTDLLISNYEDTVIQIQQVIKKISNNLPQKCEKTIRGLSLNINQQSSLGFKQKVNFEKNKQMQFIQHLKQSIISLINRMMSFQKPHSIQKSKRQKNIEQKEDQQWMTLSSFRFKNSF